MRLINATEGLGATGRQIQVSLGIEDGRIARIADATEAAEDIIVMPALVNAHDHARPLRARVQNRGLCRPRNATWT